MFVIVACIADECGADSVIGVYYASEEPDDVEAEWAGEDDDADTCPDCQGSGYIPAIGPDAPDSGYVECDTCHGTGAQ